MQNYPGAGAGGQGNGDNVHTADRIIECGRGYFVGSAPWRIELPQGGVVRGDPEVPRGRGPGLNPDGSPSGTDDPNLAATGGCGCRTAPAGGSLSLSLAALGLAALLGRRRQRSMP